MEQQVIYVFTHDSIFVGEDGPTHQPVEHISALRTIPNLLVLRPGSRKEVALAWATALRRKTGPTALILTRQKLEPSETADDKTYLAFDRGGYVYQSEEKQPIDLVLIGTGSELSLAADVARKLQDEDMLSVRVVSMPSLERYLRQNEGYREEVIPDSTRGVLIVEAGISFGWGDVTRKPYQVVSIERFGASAPYKVLAEKFGFTVENVATRARIFMSELR
jgi:transketolase